MTLIGSAIHLKDGSKGTIIGIRQNRPWFIDIENTTDGSRSVSTANVTIEGESFTQWLMRYDIPLNRDGWSKLVQMCSPTNPISQPATIQTQAPTRLQKGLQYGAGLIKWCGGQNNKTGKENEFGFIDTKYGDIYFERSKVVSPWSDLRPGVRVLYRRIKGRRNELAAGEVQILDDLLDHDLIGYLHAKDDPEGVSLDEQLLSLFDVCEDIILRDEVMIRIAKIGSRETLSRLAEKMTTTLTSDVRGSLLEKIDANILLRKEATGLRFILPFHRHVGVLTKLPNLIDYDIEALEIIRKSCAVDSKGKAALLTFWRKFPPTSPKDPFFPFAPIEVKIKVCEQHYSEFRKMLKGLLFESVIKAKTSLAAEEIYKKLDKHDDLLTKKWSGESNLEPVMAQMLSARAAEKVAKELYEEIGIAVEDVSIRQLDPNERDWTTHDLLLNSTVPVDVKNARRSIGGSKFYVEHTIPRFKQDRRNVHVQIAGILSPYLNYKHIRNPAGAPFKTEDLIFLGETSQNTIDHLASQFGSEEFEVTRGYEGNPPGK